MLWKTSLSVCFLISILMGTSALAVEPPTDAKPLAVLVFDQNCKAWCAKVRPMVVELKQNYGDKVMFAELDVTDNVLPEAKKQAKQLGIATWVDDSRDYVPMVFVFTAKRKLVKELIGPKLIDDYRKHIDKAVESSK